VDAPLRLQEAGVAGLVAEFRLSEADLGRSLSRELQEAQASEGSSDGKGMERGLTAKAAKACGPRGGLREGKRPHGVSCSAGVTRAHSPLA
jgi:hypothetical protein